MTATYTGGTGLDSPDGGSDLGLGAVASGYASNYLPGGCVSTESGAYSECTASSNQSWVSGLRVEASGLVNTAVVFADVAANTSTSSRSATITVRNACGESASFTYTQKGAQNYVFLIGPSYGNITNTSETDSILQIGQSQAMLIESTLNGSFCEASVTSNTASSWLEVKLQRASSSNYYTLSYNAPANNTYSTRSGVITVTQSGSNKTVTLSVSQAGIVAGCQVVGSMDIYDGYVSCNFNVDSSHTCGSGFRSAGMMITITGGEFRAGGGYTLDSSKENATITGITTSSKVTTLYYDLHSGYTCQNIHISGVVVNTGNEGECGSCTIGYSTRKHC